MVLRLELTETSRDLAFKPDAMVASALVVKHILNHCKFPPNQITDLLTVLLIDNAFTKVTWIAAYYY
jgi:hypothetical protein